ncbi:MAG: S-layer family protein [Moorea sp. SIO2I5]|nr:S-layer family protein [Moorena sp. SIO2I5]
MITLIVDGDFIMEDRAKIEAKSQQGATGDGNDIIIEAGSLSLSNKSFITAEARQKSTGNPGKITITVKDKIEITGLSSAIKTQIDQDAGNQQTLEESAADITITARSLSIKDGGRIEASTRGKIKAGDVTINTTDFVDISEVWVNSDQTQKRESGLFTQTRNGAEAEGGRIEITTKSFRLSDGALLDAKSESDFRGGDIKIDADEVKVTDGAKIIATSQKSRGGDITLDSDTLTVNNSEISASTADTGTAGNVEVKAKDSVLITGTLPDNPISPSLPEDPKSPAGIFAQATEGGTAKNVTIETDELTVEKGARIAVSGVPLTEQGFPEPELDENERGEAGKLTIEAESLTLDNGQLVAATGKNPTNNEEAATIDIDVPGVIILDNNSLILADATGNDVDGGNITIEGGVLVALPLNNQDKGSDIFANAQDGDGGKINITLQGLFNLNVLEDTNAFIGSDGKIDPSLAFQNNSSEIAALSFSGGQSGTVTRDITNSAQDSEILPTSIVDPSALIVANCPRSGKVAVDELGEFIVTGRGGLPPSPLDPITQQSVLVDWVTIDTGEETIEEATSTPTPDVSYLPMRGKRRAANTPTPARPKKKIVEAQGWTVGEDGTIILTAEPNTGIPKSNWYNPRSCGSKG